MATDVHQVRCFVTVAEESHFGRAAERLHLTPSPVSRAVKELERELGLEFTVGVAGRRDRAEADDDVAALVAAARRTWPTARA
jgi:DNA-binding Lrp family transcriptional regulator